MMHDINDVLTPVLGEALIQEMVDQRFKRAIEVYLADPRNHHAFMMVGFQQLFDTAYYRGAEVGCGDDMRFGYLYPPHAWAMLFTLPTFTDVAGTSADIDWYEYYYNITVIKTPHASFLSLPSRCWSCDISNTMNILLQWDPTLGFSRPETDPRPVDIEHEYCFCPVHQQSMYVIFQQWAAGCAERQVFISQHLASGHQWCAYQKYGVPEERDGVLKLLRFYQQFIDFYAYFMDELPDRTKWEPGYSTSRFPTYGQTPEEAAEILARSVINSDPFAPEIVRICVFLEKLLAKEVDVGAPVSEAELLGWDNVGNYQKTLRATGGDKAPYTAVADPTPYPMPGLNPPDLSRQVDRILEGDVTKLDEIGREALAPEKHKEKVINPDKERIMAEPEPEVRVPKPKRLPVGPGFKDFGREEGPGTPGFRDKHPDPKIQRQQADPDPVTYILIKDGKPVEVDSEGGQTYNERDWDPYAVGSPAGSDSEGYDTDESVYDSFSSDSEDEGFQTFPKSKSVVMYKKAYRK